MTTLYSRIQFSNSQVAYAQEKCSENDLAEYANQRIGCWPDYAKPPTECRASVDRLSNSNQMKINKG